jgi:hypothetical protein
VIVESVLFCDPLLGFFGDDSVNDSVLGEEEYSIVDGKSLSVCCTRI